MVVKFACSTAGARGSIGVSVELSSSSRYALPVAGSLNIVGCLFGAVDNEAPPCPAPPVPFPFPFLAMSLAFFANSFASSRVLPARPPPSFTQKSAVWYGRLQLVQKRVPFAAPLMVWAASAVASLVWQQFEFSLNQGSEGKARIAEFKGALKVPIAIKTDSWEIEDVTHAQNIIKTVQRAGIGSQQPAFAPPRCKRRPVRRDVGHVPGVSRRARERGAGRRDQGPGEGSPEA